MIKEPNMSVEQPHSLGAVLKGAILLIFFVFGVTTYAQSYNAPISYRVSGTTQSTASAEQWNGGGVSAGQTASGVYGTMSGSYNAVNTTYRVSETASREANADGPLVGYKGYQPSVYEPFNDTPPSESGNSNSGPKGISGRKNLGGVIDPGNQGGSPVGEPFVLLLFAAVAAVVVAWRQRKPC